MIAQLVDAVQELGIGSRDHGRDASDYAALAGASGARRLYTSVY